MLFLKHNGQATKANQADNIEMEPQSINYSFIPHMAVVFTYAFRLRTYHSRRTRPSTPTIHSSDHYAIIRARLQQCHHLRHRRVGISGCRDFFEFSLSRRCCCGAWKWWCCRWRRGSAELRDLESVVGEHSVDEYGWLPFGMYTCGRWWQR